MAKGPNETTDRLFPHQMLSESGEVERPIPLQPSIRVAFEDHHGAILGYFATFEGMLDRRLPKAGDPHLPSPASVRQRVTGGALAGVRFGAQVLMASQLAADLAHELGFTQLEGPLRMIVEVLSGL